MWKVELNFAGRLGANLHVNTPYLISYKGTPIFRVRRNDADGMLGIDFDVFDAKGARLATFAKGAVVEGDAANYAIETGHEVYTVTERSSGRVIARVQRRGVSGAEMEVSVCMYLPSAFLPEADRTP